jgi:hypothetical protein
VTIFAADMTQNFINKRKKIPDPKIMTEDSWLLNPKNQHCILIINKFINKRRKTLDPKMMREDSFLLHKPLKKSGLEAAND